MGSTTRLGALTLGALMTRAFATVRRLMAAALVVNVVAGCAGANHGPGPAKLPADYTGSGPGTLLAAYPLSQTVPGLTELASLSARIEYTSTSGIDDSHPTVDAAVFVPQGAPPTGGWPVVALGHPMTGIDADCAPTRSSTLSGTSDAIATLLVNRYVVVATDYQGLGLTNTYHPFLDSTTVGLNLIDSVFATRRLVPATAVDWIAAGVQQGGQAAWAADELAENAGVGLHLVGAISLLPLADMTGLADLAMAGQLSVPQRLIFRDYLATLKKEYPDFDLDHYRRGMVKDEWNSLSKCDDPEASDSGGLAAHMTPDQLRPDNPEAADILHGFLDKSTLPQGPTAAPLLVGYGGDDAIAPATWTERAVRRACERGDQVQVESGSAARFRTVDAPETLDWMRARFSGAPARDDCRELLLPTPPAAPGPSASDGDR